MRIRWEGCIVNCGRCGRDIPIEQSSEWQLVKDGTMMVEFYYCADREACDAAQEGTVKGRK